MWASFNEIDRIEIAAQSTVEFLLQNMTGEYFRQLLVHPFKKA